MGKRNQKGQNFYRKFDQDEGAAKPQNFFKPDLEMRIWGCSSTSISQRPNFCCLQSLCSN